MTAFGTYFNDIQKNLARGDATEHTHRTALQALLQSVAKGITATNEPKHIPIIGAPDFKVSRGRIPLGNVETKDIGTDLAEMERGKGPNGDQFIRYSALPNWILTDYLEFHWFTHGERRRVVRIAELVGKNKIKLLPKGEKELADLLESFIRCPALTVGTAEQLADSMAGYARTMQQQTIVAIQHEADGGWLHQWLRAFQGTLIPDLDEQKFSDMFAQTLVYGLFAARVHTPEKEDFTRNSAARAIPKTNPFLQQLFYEITGPKLPDSIAWVMEDIVALLNHADMHEILKDFGKGKGKSDPVVHFYETFLAAYDPKLREVRGVYYTPEPVVSYIVRSVDYLLKEKFKRPKGLADENTLILDPATGTATFLYFVIEQIFEKFAKQKGAWDGYVEKNLLNRVFGFELLIAPYAIAHLKLGMQLQETGYQFGSDQRLGVYLTNTLEEAAKKTEQLISGWIADEANAAAKIKQDEPIMVVLGNPPYSGHSANRSWVEKRVEKGERYVADFDNPQGVVQPVYRIADKQKFVEVPTFIGQLIQDYYLVDGVWLGERNPKWLQNDYVKFIRFAQWRIDKTGEGIIGFITSNSYLDSPTFRGMRQSLMRSFNEIYIYDLHGNSNKKERALDGGEDKNVFDITEGVSLMLCVKEKGNKNLAQVFQADLLGTREAKYKQLAESDVSETDWEKLKPVSPNYFFMPQTVKRRMEYEKFWQVTEMMPKNLLGFQTHRDPVAIALDEATLKKQVADYLGKEPSEADWKANCRLCDYRPFDRRFVYLHSSVTDRPRLDIIAHLFKPNLALNTVRQTKATTWQHAVVSNRPTPAVFVEIKDGSNIFPLYLYDDPEAENKKRGGGTMLMALFESSPGYVTRRANLNPKFIADLTQMLGLKWLPVDCGDLTKTVGPEDVFNYIYAVFHSPAYRERYAEFLKIDFPRLPLTGDLKLFRALAAKGAELVTLHLMESPKLDELFTEFPVRGDCVVEKVQYTDNDERVWINVRQYFGGVPKEVWEFHVGGYQVCEKWLKDRKGRTLTHDDIEHYQRTVSALAETRSLMAQIDALIADHGGWPLK
jgi:predicted helicase